MIRSHHGPVVVPCPADDSHAASGVVVTALRRAENVFEIALRDIPIGVVRGKLVPGPELYGQPFGTVTRWVAGDGSRDKHTREEPKTYETMVRAAYALLSEYESLSTSVFAPA